MITIKGSNSNSFESFDNSIKTFENRAEIFCNNDEDLL
jgi:hypothetical protein